MAETGGGKGGGSGSRGEEVAGLGEHELPDEPLTLVREWLDDAEARSGLRYPNAVHLSTVDARGRPDGRVVLLKGMDARGFVFYTNLQSRKAEHLAGRPSAALTFFWEATERQIRIRGEVEPVPEREADEYFRTRPRGSQVGAWASEQSRPVQDRAALEGRFREMEARFEGGDIPRPPHWGGFRLVAREVEFWLGRAHRLHDRVLFRRGSAGSWSRVRLFP